jgi:hypothetical protein
MCVCGKPETLGVVHSLDVPCFNYQPPDPRADAFAREFYVAAILGNKAAADGASEKLLRYVLSTPPTDGCHGAALKLKNLSRACGNRHWKTEKG